MISALVVFYFLVALCLIVLVLLQDPKGSGAIFGGGGSQSLFGATGATSFIVKATRAIAILFALCVIGINYMLMSQSSKSAVYETDTEIEAPVLETEPESATEEGEATQDAAPVEADAVEVEAAGAAEAEKEVTEEESSNEDNSEDM